MTSAPAILRTPLGRRVEIAGRRHGRAGGVRRTARCGDLWDVLRDERRLS